MSTAATGRTLYGFDADGRPLGKCGALNPRDLLPADVRLVCVEGGGPMDRVSPFAKTAFPHLFAGTVAKRKGRPVAEPATLGTIAALLRELVGRSKPAPLMIDREQFAALMSIAVSTFEKLRAAGLIGPAGVWVGGSLRWHRDDVTAWLSSRNHKGELYAPEDWPAVLKQLRDR